MANIGNLPPSNNNNTTTEYFNNFFGAGITVNQNINDSVIGFFQSITGDNESGRTLASSVIYTAISQGMNPMEFIDDLRRMKSNKQKENREPMDSEQFVVCNSYQQIESISSDYGNGQLFFIPETNLFYKLTILENQTQSITIAQGYAAQKIVLRNSTIVYNYFKVSYIQEQNDLNAYLALFLNMNRVGSSLLGISNSPQTNKYIARAILI